ncbi:capsular polysaccharide export protein, LipB/KpsS family [Hyphomicrobium sp.]|uniref:capsular polysaccharide export protein, LipB/KpsS family n=1 Tax=Hyphomicrobium sp. TaxID=82 RepID=UPI002FDD63B7
MARHRRCLLYRFTGEEAAGNAYHLAATLRASGRVPVVVPLWDDGLHWSDVEQSPLIEGCDLESVPRLSAFAFRRRHGYDLDLIDLSAHNFAIGDIHADTLLTESVWSQKLRGVAATIHRLIGRLNPEAVFVSHGAEVISRIVAAVASRMDCKLLYWESPFFPGYHFVDPVGPHFFRGACRIDTCLAPSRARSDAARDEGRSFVERWRAMRQSKYPQYTAPAERDRLNRWLAMDTRPVVLIAGQLAKDANVVVSLGAFARYEDSVQAAARAVPDGWRTLFKPHPLDPAPERWVDILSDQAWIASDVSLHDIFPVSEAVATHSSNAGLEALMAGCPVIVWGRPVYRAKGVTHDLEVPEDIARVLGSGMPTPPDPERVATLVGQIVGDGLVAHGDGAALARLIEEASVKAAPARLSWYGAPVQQAAAAAHAMERALSETGRVASALDTLPAQQRALFESCAGSDLHRRVHGGPIMPERERIVPDLATAFNTAGWPERVLFDPTDLQQERDPAAALARIEEAVQKRTSVAISLSDATERSWTLQRLTHQDVSDLLQEQGLSAAAFGINAGRLTRFVEGHGVYVLRRGARPISAALIQRLTTTPLPYTLSADLFSYPEPTTSVGEAREIRLAEGRHVVFGAPVILPRGRWMATFRLNAKRTLQERAFARARARVTLDVYKVGDRIVGMADVALPAWRQPSLTFEADGVSDYECRVYAHGPAAAPILRFSGVSLVSVGEAEPLPRDAVASRLWAGG